MEPSQAGEGRVWCAWAATGQGLGDEVVGTLEQGLWTYVLREQEDGNRLRLCWPPVPSTLALRVDGDAGGLLEMLSPGHHEGPTFPL